MKFSMKPDKSLLADLMGYTDEQKKKTTEVVKRLTNGLKQSLRDDIAAAKLGTKLPKTWRSELYPKSGDSLTPAGVVFSTAPHIIDGFDRGGVVRAKGHKYIAIPSQFAPAHAGRNKSMTPQWFNQGRHGKLEFVKFKRIAALVVRNQRKSFATKSGDFRGYKKATDAWKRRGGETETVVMFWLIPQVTLRRRLDVNRTVQKWQSEMSRAMLEIYQ